jgi:hypothetical protein
VGQKWILLEYDTPEKLRRCLDDRDRRVLFYPAVKQMQVGKLIDLEVTAGDFNVLFPLKAMVIARRERPQGTRSPRGVYLEIIQEDTERFGRLCDFADGRWRPGNRRQAPRLRAEIRASYFLPPKFYWGETSDVSSQGVFLRTDEVMPQVGEGVFIRLYPWRMWFPISLSARVCWIDEVDTRRGMGLFCFDTPRSLRRLGGLVERLRKKVKI